MAGWLAVPNLRIAQVVAAEELLDRDPLACFWACFWTSTCVNEAVVPNR